MRIYIAGKFNEKQQIREHMNKLEELGHNITHDWTSFETTKTGNEKMAESAVKDLHGVLNADCLVCIMTDPDYAYRGTFSEIGAGLATNKIIIIINDDSDAYCTSNVFYHHPSIFHVKTWSEALLLLHKM
jgi:hypothetical protein